MNEHESGTGPLIARIVIGLLLLCAAVAFVLVGWENRQGTAALLGTAAGLAGVAVGGYVVFRGRGFEDEDDEDEHDLGLRPPARRRPVMAPVGADGRDLWAPDQAGSRDGWPPEQTGSRAESRAGSRSRAEGRDRTGVRDRWAPEPVEGTPAPLTRRASRLNPPGQTADQPTAPFGGPPAVPFGGPPAAPLGGRPARHAGPPAHHTLDALVRAVVYDGPRYEAGTQVRGEYGFVAARPFESFLEVVKHLAVASPQQVLFTVNLFNPANAPARTAFDEYYGHQLTDRAYPREAVDAYLHTLREAAWQFDRSGPASR